MEYLQVQDILESAFNELPYDVMFGSGREADFNQVKDRKYPMAWLDPMERNASNPNTFINTETWDITIVVLVKADKNDNNVKQNEIVDFGHQIANDFIVKLDENESIEFSNTPRIRPLHRTTFGTEHTGGCIISFTLIVPDNYTC